MTPPVPPPEVIAREIEFIIKQRKEENEKKAWRIKKPDFFQAWGASSMINRFARKGKTMVKRSIGFIRKNYYLVALSLESHIIGTIGLVDWDKEGIELVSHCVYSNFGSMGVGIKLFEEVLKEVKRRQPASFFLCTTAVDYYSKLGFVVADPKKYTEKIRQDCAKCKNGSGRPGFPPCPEIAMEYTDPL